MNILVINCGSSSSEISSSSMRNQKRYSQKDFVKESGLTDRTDLSSRQAKKKTISKSSDARPHTEAIQLVH